MSDISVERNKLNPIDWKCASRSHQPVVKQTHSHEKKKIQNYLMTNHSQSAWERLNIESIDCHVPSKYRHSRWVRLLSLCLERLRCLHSILFSCYCTFLCVIRVRWMSFTRRIYLYCLRLVCLLISWMHGMVLKEPLLPLRMGHLIFSMWGRQATADMR